MKYQFLKVAAFALLQLQAAAVHFYEDAALVEKSLDDVAVRYQKMKYYLNYDYVFMLC